MIAASLRIYDYVIVKLVYTSKKTAAILHIGDISVGVLLGSVGSGGL